MLTQQRSGEVLLPFEASNCLISCKVVSVSVCLTDFTLTDFLRTNDGSFRRFKPR